MCIIIHEHEILARIISIVCSEFSNLNFYLEKIEVKTNKAELKAVIWLEQTSFVPTITVLFFLPNLSHFIRDKWQHLEYSILFP